ncbi:MAG: ATP-grasp domain-containing protein [Candidatus Bathyarchaeota archaeon]|jgi:predicted ATP-grasp superfamily ATP-dependent carboligase|nr:MAG: ATP-grasp domain-containing protein [Candidatus Bathyarchaeota archaeon]
MKKDDVRNVLVMGLDIAALAASAERVGYCPFSVDYFGDQDLRALCVDSLSVVEQRHGVSCGKLEDEYSPIRFLELARNLQESYRLDAALLSSGLEDSQEVLGELDEIVPIIGNDAKTVQRVRDKTAFFEELRRLNIPHPQTSIIADLEEARKEAESIGYPVLVKPVRGFGGIGIRKAQNEKELAKVLHAKLPAEGVLIQEFISGTNISISFISNTENAEVLSINEQLLGVEQAGQSEPFGYSGTIVPLNVSKRLEDCCEFITKRISSHFGLKGSNGLDLVVSGGDKVKVIEVNPRFQATLECVETLLGINLVQAHIDACLEAILPSHVTENESSVICSRLILCAKQRSQIPHLGNLAEIRDVPFPGTIVEKGEPVCSIVVKAKDRGSICEQMYGLIYKIYRRINADSANL